jgi:hypothetical protein
MSNVAISQLPVATTATAADEIPIVQGGVTKKLTNALLFSTSSLASATGLPIVAGTTGTLTVARGGTGSTTSTGTGTVVLSTSPTLVTPTLGVATATSINKVAITAPATSATLTIANGKTLTANNSLTLAGTDGKTLTTNNSLTLEGTDSTTMTFPSTSASIARTDAAQTFTGNQTFNGAIIESVQGLSGPGAVNITQSVTKFTSTAAGNALTLVDGVEGQRKTIVYVAEAAGGDTGVLTPSNLANGTSITFGAVGDTCVLQFLGSEWWVILLRGAVLA